VQESFIKAYQNIDSFEGRSSFKSWLYQIAVNTAKNCLRAKKGEAVKLDAVQIAVDGQAHNALEQMDLKELVQKYVDILPEKQRTALVLRIFEDLSFKEIARIMDCPYDTAKANYRHAIMKLRHQFAEDQFLKDWEEPSYEPTVGTSYLEVEQ
jgi:RNA polymerase sigma-70 factor (ECF subfamily)